MRQCLALIECGPAAEAKCAGDFKLGLHFKVRAASDAEKLPVFRSIEAAVAFGDIAGDGDCGATQLGTGTVELFAGKCRGEVIDGYGELDGLLPNGKIAKGCTIDFPCAASL